MGSAVDTNATLGNTDLAAEFGFWAGACLPLGLALCLFLTGIFFAKPMNRMGLTSFPDYYRLRFGRPVEVAASVMLIDRVLHAGGRESGRGRLPVQLLPRYAVLAGRRHHRGLAVAYTGTGGLIADAYTAIIQMTLVLIGAVGLLIWMTSTHGLAIAEGMGPLALGQTDRSRAGRRHQLGDAHRTRHRRHRRDRFHAAGVRREVAGRRAQGVLQRRRRDRRDLRTVRSRRAGRELVPARGTRRPGAVRAARPVRARWP